MVVTCKSDLVIVCLQVSPSAYPLYSAKVKVPETFHRALLVLTTLFCWIMHQSLLIPSVSAILVFSLSFKCWIFILAVLFVGIFSSMAPLGLLSFPFSDLSWYSHSSISPYLFKIVHPFQHSVFPIFRFLLRGFFISGNIIYKFVSFLNRI
jgi:hypothetical protein